MTPRGHLAPLSLCAPSNIPSGPSATHLAGRGQNGKDLGADTLSFQPYPQRQKTCAIQIVSSEVAKVDYPQTRCTCRVLLWLPLLLSLQRSLLQSSPGVEDPRHGEANASLADRKPQAWASSSLVRVSLPGSRSTPHLVPVLGTREIYARTSKIC